MGTGESSAGNHDYTTTYRTCGTIPLPTTPAHPGNPAGVPPQIVPVDERFRKKFAEGSGKNSPDNVRPCPELPTPNRKPPFNGGPPTGIPAGFLE